MGIRVDCPLSLRSQGDATSPLWFGRLESLLKGDLARGPTGSPHSLGELPLLTRPGQTAGQPPCFGPDCKKGDRNHPLLSVCVRN